MSEIYNTLKQGLEDAINHNVTEWVQVRHGHWEKGKDIYGTYYKCSLCDQAFNEFGYSFNYCPECGAKMDEERREE